MKLLSKFYNKMNITNSMFYTFISAALPAVIVLLIPLAAMQFSGEVNWSLLDFAVAWSLLFGAGFIYRIIARKSKIFTYRIAVGIAVATALLLFWVNLAVGLIGTEDNPANLMYLGVLAIGFLGAIVVRLQPKGMARVLYAMVYAHALIVVIALIARLHITQESSVVEIIGVNGFFAVLWTGSALLFRNAAQLQTKS